jgi:hypothetical protein
MTDKCSSAATEQTLPCPFCGSETLIGDTGTCWVRCASVDCGAEGPLRDNETDAITAWNAGITNVAQQPGMREALEAARSEIVVAISFLGRDLNTDRLTETVDSLITRLSKADADARAALAAQPPAAPVETRGAGVEMINNLTPSELANWQDDGNCNAGHAKCSAGTGEEWNPTSEQVGSACMWYRHDFGLLGPVEAAQVRTEARMWLRAWQKEIAGIRAAPQEARNPADDLVSQIEQRFPDWKSYRDLLDCIDCTLHQLRAEVRP